MPHRLFRILCNNPCIGRVSSRRAGAARALLQAAALLLSLHGLAGAAAAQEPQSAPGDPCSPDCDELGQEPFVPILPDSGTYSQASIPVLITFTDDHSLAPGSMVIKLNDSTVTAAFQYTPMATTSVVRARAVGTVTLRPGVNRLTAWISDQTGFQGTATVQYAFGAPGVAVSPDGGTAYVALGNAPSQTFTVRNTGPASATFELRAVCREVDSGVAMSPCTISPGPSVTLDGGTSTTVSVAHGYGAPGTSVSVELRARQTGVLAVEDAGWIEVDVHQTGGSPGAMGVALVDLNTSGQISRGECVTVSVGVGAAYECGDLRLAHGVPGIATLGRARAPVLLYNSQQASPYPTVYADVTLPSSASMPQQVVATVTLANGTTMTRTFTGSDWWPGMTRRIGVQWDGRQETGWLKGYTLQLTAVYAGAQYSTSVQGEMAVVNRLDSPFGSGWWLAGLEQISSLFIPGSTRGMLRYGDGSTRLLEEVVHGEKWVAHNPDGRPDTLILEYLPTGAQYKRTLQGGGQIHYDPGGRHVRTVSRLNDTTHFSYDAQTGRLAYVSVPGRDGVARGFRFTYTGTYLTAVTPEIGGVAQPGITLARDGGRTLAITDPDGLVTRFGFADAANPYRITSRTSRDSTVVTYGYDAAGRLSSASLALSDTESIVTTFTAAESRGVNPSSTTTGSSALVSRAYTLIDGPRADVVDQTRIWVTSRGAPRRIRDAMGGETVLRRTHPTYPSLVTEVRGTNAGGDSLVVRSRATYDDRGRVRTSTAVNSLGNGADLTTTYAYDDRWDAPDTITAPGVGPTVMEYDTVTGNVRWQQQGDDQRRVYFDYNTTGPHRGLLAQVRHPHPVTGAAGGGGADSLGYDPMGNLRFTRSPRPQGFLTYHYRDHFGRDTLTITPVRPDSADTEAELRGNGTRTRTIYDIMGRVRRTESIGRSVALPGTSRVAPRIAPGETVRVETAYDDMGRPREVTRWSTPDSAGVGMLTTFYRYDRAGRKIIENSLATGRDSTAYDPAGNAVAVVTARQHVIRMRYDALGRLVQRDVPSATDNQACVPGGSCPDRRFPFYPSNGAGGFTAPAETFLYRYDAAGNQVYAENRDAIVTRTYLPGGALQTDTTRMRAYAGMEFPHVFGLEYRYYAQTGQLRAMQHPANLTGTVQADSFAYSPVTGALTQAWSRQGYGYDFEHDLLGRPVRTVYPGGTVPGAERTTYDEQGRRTLRIDSIPGGVLAEDAYTYDARGKMTFVSGQVGGEQTEFRNWYSGLGNLLGTDWGSPLSDARITEVYSVDGMGNQARSTTWSEGNGSPPTSRNAYRAGTGRITSIGRILSAQPGETAIPDSTYRHYDGAGNVTWGEYKGWGEYFNGAVAINHITISRNYYGADQKLREVQVDDRTTTGTSWSQNGSFSEYRYDALGRRIMERVRRDSVCTTHECESTLTRFVWAGDQLLWELRVPGGNNVTGSALDATAVAGAMYGRVSYFHAGGIDKPLLITKEGVESVVPRDTWRGQFHAGTSPTTGASRNCPIGVQTGCLLVDWPGMRTNAQHGWAGEQPDIDVWYGGLVDGMRDASGQMYMRNRYYDPATGQFTQTDPIGIAGGLNVYGFAAGDPVSYSDPYGLCPMCVAALVVVEVVSTVYDAYATYQTFRQEGRGEGLQALHASAWGLIVPGPGNAYRSGANALQNTVQGNRLAGQAGEGFLRSAFGGGPVSLPTSRGWRHVDNLTGGIAQESKVGNVRMSPRIREEILRDAELLQNPASGVTRAEWHFFPNAQGESNVSNSVLELLHQNGIVPNFWASKP